MAGGASCGSRNSVYGVKSKNLLKKGPWTSSEDLILIEYVTKHGEGNWNAVQRNTGLMRCGKSCRLRWANHLRPNLKKGAFSPEEEKLITELHAKLGNKWAKMATMVPGRTDNEIKNYWNTRLKRRQKAGLPIYPPQGTEEEVQLNSSSSSSNQKNPDFSHFFDSDTSPQIQQSCSYVNNNQMKLYNPNNGGQGLLFGGENSFSPTSLFFNENPLTPSPMGSLLQLSSHSYRADPGLELEIFGLPSIQPPQGAQDYDAPPGDKNYGLLQDLLGQSRASVWPEKPQDPFFLAAETVHGNPAFIFDGISKGNSSLDEDLLNLLDSFPMSVPIPEWDEGRGGESGLLSNPAANQEWNFGSYIWNNMPTIY